jgi:hypothetical protein
MFSRVGLSGVAKFAREVGQIVPNMEIKAMSLVIHSEPIADQDAIRQVNRLAFGQDDEARLVDALRERKNGLVVLLAKIGHFRRRKGTAPPIRPIGPIS